jgi:hypothetical protein
MVELTNRIRGVLMGHGPDALREVFEDESADRALQELTVAQLADRLDGLGLAGVSDEALLRLVRRMDASNDGIVTYAEFSSYLQQRKFAGQVTRILRTAARALAAQGVTLQEVLELTALRAGSADLMRPHSEVPAILHPALLRHLLLTVLGVPLSQAHFTAVAAMADLDGNGDVDVEEVRPAGVGGGTLPPPSPTAPTPRTPGGCRCWRALARPTALPWGRRCGTCMRTRCWTASQPSWGSHGRSRIPTRRLPPWRQLRRPLSRRHGPRWRRPLLPQCLPPRRRRRPPRPPSAWWRAARWTRGGDPRRV